jgi:hypothetical protein
MMTADEALLLSLNNSPIYDHSITINNILHANDDTNTFTRINLASSYYDLNSIIKNFSNTNIPLILSLNAQSLQSKFNALSEFITHLTNNKVRIDIITLQETWSIPYIDLFTIPGFHPPILETRTMGRGGGGGVGFYN